MSVHPYLLGGIAEERLTSTDGENRVLLASASRIQKQLDSTLQQSNPRQQPAATSSTVNSRPHVLLRLRQDLVVGKAFQAKKPKKNYEFFTAVVRSLARCLLALVSWVQPKSLGIHMHPYRHRTSKPMKKTARIHATAGRVRDNHDRGSASREPAVTVPSLTSSTKEPNMSDAYTAGPSATSPPTKYTGLKLNVEESDAV